MRSAIDAHPISNRSTSDTDPSRRTRAWSASLILTAQFFVLIYFQKLAVPLMASTQISLAMACFFVLLAYGLMAGVYRLEIGRLLFFGIFTFFAVLSQASVVSYSMPSLALLLVLCGAMTFTWFCSQDEYLAVCENFSRMMLLPAAAVFAQYLYQTIHGAGVSLSIEPFIPQAFLLKGFMYETSTAHWVTWNRSNGLVFLEPSYCSAFLACAAINDWYILRRRYRAIIFVAALAATNGGTGTLMLAIAIASLGFMRRPLTTAFVVTLAAIALTLLDTLPTGLPLLSRLGELANTQSSGYGRLLLPMTTAINVISDPAFLFHGFGAGQISAEYGSAWPITKLAFEYGTLAAMSYFVFICGCMYKGVNVPLRIALFTIFQFTGGYLLNPILSNLIILCCAGRIVIAERLPKFQLDHVYEQIAFRDRSGALPR